LSYDDELFPLLYYDIDDFSANAAPRVFSHGRSISLYGIRGVGKTTAAQGVIVAGLRSLKGRKYLPVSISVKRSRSVSSLAELEDRFYSSTLEAFLRVTTLRGRYGSVKKAVRNYAPWVAEKAVEASSLIYPPAFLASDVVKKAVEKLLEKAGFREPEKLTLAKDVDTRASVDFILDDLSREGVTPVCTVDELTTD